MGLQGALHHAVARNFTLGSVVDLLFQVCITYAQLTRYEFPL